MTTYPHRLRAGRPHVDLWLVASAVLAAALVGLGAWVLVDRYAGGGGATQDATTLIDRVNTAISTGDTNAISSLYASDAVLKSLGSTYTGVAAIRELARTGVTAERIAPVTVDVTVNGQFATTWIGFTGGDMRGTAIAVFQITDGKVLRQWAFQLGSTPPFDNAFIWSF